MTYSRPSALLLVASLLVGLFSTAGASVALATNPPPQCTGWTDEFHPPTEVRVRRTSGPNAGHVETVPFWNYVGTVLRTEYSSGSTKGPLWMRVGALSVKEYAWYYAMHWRGGKVVTTNEDGSTTTECFDLKDGTGDQIYHPQKLVNGEWVPTNIPTAANLAGMADTWHMSLRKWQPVKMKSRLFLTGYRSGKQKPCGTDSTGSKIFQKSLRDCGTKGLTFEETLRRYYEPNALIVDPRKHDILDDNGGNGQPTYFGDLGLLTAGTGGTTAYRVYAGNDTGFAGPVTGTLSVDPSKIIGQGVGDINGDTRKDLVMLLNNGKLATAIATGTGYNDATTQDLPGSAPTAQLLVGDFDGDLLVDVGLLRSTPVAPLPDDPATLVVMRGQTNGTFANPVDWWRGALDLNTQQAQAADVTGDGKADLVLRDATGSTFSVAPSFASCVDLSGYAFTYWGACTNVPGTGLDVATDWLQNLNWVAATSKWALSDYNRDGRADLVALVKNGSDIDVFGATAAIGGGAFTNQNKMATVSGLALGDVTPLGMDINPDGLGDLVLVRKVNASTTGLQYLRAVQTTSWGNLTFSATNVYNDANVAWPGSTKPY
jgi:hypothetical protein